MDINIKPGDIVLVNTNTVLGFLQRLVYKFFKNHKTYIGHIGIMYSNTLMFEARSKLQFAPLSKFNPDKIAVIRIKNCVNLDVNSLQTLCESLYGLPYDYFQLISDVYYFATDEIRGNRNKFVCSELVSYILSKMCGNEILNKLFELSDYRVITPYHFSILKDSDKIDIIYQGSKFKW